MNNIILYHGSANIIEKPEYGKGKPYNDYGMGFYCTEHEELAKEWGCNEGIDGYANRYRLNLTDLKILDLSSEDYGVLNWLAILMDNRICRLSTPIEKSGKEYLLEHFLPDYKRYDLIIGYRADDSYFSFARSFVGNGISLMQLKYAMNLGKLGEQYVLKSRKAFEQITFLDYDIAQNEKYYPKKKSRDESAREAFMKELEKAEIDGIYMRDIIREKMEVTDVRLR